MLLSETRVVPASWLLSERCIFPPKRSLDAKSLDQEFAKIAKFSQRRDTIMARRKHGEEISERPRRKQAAIIYG